MNREQRKGYNEAVFRELNERIREISDSFATTRVEERLPLACECANPTCVERIEVGHGDYERIRSDSALFVVVPGHDAPDVEDVVEHSDRFAVVRKHPGDPTELAEATDPRR